MSETPDYSILEHLRQVIADIRSAEMGIGDVAERDAGDYLRRAAELLNSARQTVWPVYNAMRREEAEFTSGERTSGN